MEFNEIWIRLIWDCETQGLCVYECTHLGDFAGTQNTLAYTWKIKYSTLLSSKRNDFSYQHYLNHGCEIITYKQVLMFCRINSAQQRLKIWEIKKKFEIDDVIMTLKSVEILLWVP